VDPALVDVSARVRSIGRATPRRAARIPARPPPPAPERELLELWERMRAGSATGAVGIAIVIAAACGGEPARPPPRALPVDLITLAPTQVVDATEYLGTLRSRLAASLQPEVEGRIVDILVKPGDVVDAKRALVQIDPERQSAALSQVREQHTGREAQLALAQRDLERVKRLVDRNALPAQALDDARTSVDLARADVATLGAELAGSKVQLGYYRVVAPGHGVVGDIPVRVGDRVTTSTVITSVTDNRVLEANVAVPVERARELALGLAVQIVDAAGHVTGEGTIGFIAPRVDPETQSVLVKADIANGSGALRAGQVVSARVVWRRQPGLTVPALAVTRQGDQAFVFVAAMANGALLARQRPVQLGALTDNAYVVASGLRPGDRVVTSSIQKLHDGAPIAPAPPPSRAPGPGGR
jgi:RND family efflux transporter MFP subunit